MYVCIYKLNIYFLEFPNFKVIIQYYLYYIFLIIVRLIKKKNLCEKRSIKKKKKKSNSLLLLQIEISLLYRLNKVKNNCAIIDIDKI